MLRHYLTAALRNIAANRLLAAITIFGLAVGLTGAMLMALVIRNQITYDRFIANYDRTYLAVSVLAPPGLTPDYNAWTNDGTAGLLKLNVPEIRAVTRLMDKDATLRRGQITATEKIYWADPNAFQVLALPVRHGDLNNALIRPDSIVVNESTARKYFGHDDVVGQVLIVNGHPMTVTAVVADLPLNATDLQTGIFASGHAAYSPLATQSEASSGGFSISVRTYLQLMPGADIAKVEQKVPVLLGGVLPAPMLPMYSMSLIRIDRLALFDGFHPGIRTRLIVGGLIGLLILFIAAVNFVNLSLARSTRREKEVGVRKVSGAGRAQLVAQFLGESVLTVLLAAFLAVATSELLLPSVNDFLETGAAFDYWRHPALLAWLVGGGVSLGVLAGFYPAFLLSALHPTAVLRGIAQSRDASLLRKCLVMAQFAILISLLIATGVVYQQRIYASGSALRVPTANIVVVEGRCPLAFRDEVRKLSGVTGVACSGKEFLTGARFAPIYIGGKPISTDFVSTEYDAFTLYGLKPIAGFLPVSSADSNVSRIAINQTAVRRFGFASAEAALGHTVPLPRQGRRVLAMTAVIVAVVPDFALYSVETAIKPTIYLNQSAPPAGPGILQVALNGRDVPATLAEMDRLWVAVGNKEPVNRVFLDDDIKALYLNLDRDMEIFAVFAGVAVFLACLGLIGIAISTADRRVKEIGIRKVMGAENGEIQTLLLWRFAQPVLWANVIAWPVAWWAMSRWLNGFAYHVPLNWWLFPAAGGATLLVALVTVAGQAWLVARQKPVLALRYE